MKLPLSAKTCVTVGVVPLTAGVPSPKFHAYLKAMASPASTSVDALASKLAVPPSFSVAVPVNETVGG